MDNTNVYDYQNEVIGNEEFQDGLVIDEGFSYLNNDLVCKTIIFGMLFYIMNNSVMKYYIKRLDLFNVEIMQTFLFVICYYIISLYI